MTHYDVVWIRVASMTNSKSVTGPPPGPHPTGKRSRKSGATQNVVRRGCTSGCLLKFEGTGVRGGVKFEGTSSRVGGFKVEEVQSEREGC